MFIYQDEPFYTPQNNRAAAAVAVPDYKREKVAQLRTSCDRAVKRSRSKKGLTRKNKIFLESLGLKVGVVARKKKNVK